MEINFNNKVVLVTGASAGIGEAIAILFAKYGAKLALVGRNEQNLNKLADRCELEKGVATLRIVADLGTDEGCEKTASETLKHFGRLVTGTVIPVDGGLGYGDHGNMMVRQIKQAN